MTTAKLRYLSLRNAVERMAKNATNDGELFVYKGVTYTLRELKLMLNQLER